MSVFSLFLFTIDIHCILTVKHFHQLGTSYKIHFLSVWVHTISECALLNQRKSRVASTELTGTNFSAIVIFFLRIANWLFIYVETKAPNLNRDCSFNWKKKGEKKKRKEMLSSKTLSSKRHFFVKMFIQNCARFPNSACEARWVPVLKRLHDGMSFISRGFPKVQEHFGPFNNSFQHDRSWDYKLTYLNEI